MTIISVPSLEPEIPADDSLPPFPPNSSPDGGGDDDDDDDDDDDESPADDKWPPSPPKFSPDVLPCDWIMIVVFSDDPTPSTVIFPFSDLSANTFERAFQVPATGSARTSNPSEDSLNFENPIKNAELVVNIESKAWCHDPACIRFKAVRRKALTRTKRKKKEETEAKRKGMGVNPLRDVIE
ncbi:MAG: hypothetical protein GOMPHAMPRED_007021 [Gomphillus americanus]|uniref:Uncharacterized protein n=1 Tax=Gomphillus americanus TaxID=1940652 RepID=A0A8H3EN36_9LECA|nr:MAG: hypothetical protein GOMPHAMPRED_007021 [Gomphillus americanus]